MTTKLYMHPASTTSRAVLLFTADAGVEVETIVVDLMTGEHHKEPFITINPSRQVPVLDDDGFVLTESSAILKYLAEKTGSDLYPSELQARARVNEVMDWFNTGFYRELAYHVVYPQVFPHHKRPDDAVQRGTLDWGVKQSGFFLDVLDRHILGDRPFVAGDNKTIADHFGAALLSSARLIGQPFDAYPNVARWFEAMRALPCWAEVNQVFDGFVGSLSEQRFVCV